MDSRKPNLSVVKMVPRNRLMPGTVVWAHVPFDDVEDSKTRPAVVVAVRGRDVELLPVTSSESRYRYPHAYFEIDDPSTVGLDRRCAIRRRPVVVDRIDLLGVVGELDDELADLVLADLCGTAA